jgi:hypothetical protein
MDNVKPTTDQFSLDLTQNIFWGECISSDDPLMLGRVRVAPLNENFGQRENSAKGYDPFGSPNKNGPWSDKDPFIFLPYLPFFINQIPQPKERVMLFYFDRRKRSGRNKFYMIAPYSSPLTIGFEDSKSSRTNLDDGYSNSKQSYPTIKDADGKYKNPEQNTGLFSEPLDISINGRDSADMILKKNEVLLRAGKHQPFEKGQIPIINNKRAFLQLSNFDKKTTFGPEEQYEKVTQRKEQIKFIIEYYCVTTNSQFDVFTGGVNIYQIPEGDIKYELQVGVFDVGTNYTGETNLIYNKQIIGKPIDEFTSIINQVIIDFKDRPGSLVSVSDGQQFTYYYRPDSTIRSIISDFTGIIDVVSVTNMTNLVSKVRVSSADIITGYGLVINKNLDKNLPIDKITETVNPATTEKINNTSGIIGADSLYFISHETKIDGKERVDIDNTVYGIDVDTVINNIEPNTSSMVRGDELMELLQLIVEFLVTHDHPYPMLPPTPISKSSQISTQSVLAKMQEAYDKVLNKKIRIN